MKLQVYTRCNPPILFENRYGAAGFAYEYAGEVFDNFSMEERMTACNMSIEGGARVGYVNPDQKTLTISRQGNTLYLPILNGTLLWKTGNQWHLIRVVTMTILFISKLQESHPTVTWGINPAQAISASRKNSEPDQLTGLEETSTIEALEYMKLDVGAPIQGYSSRCHF